MTDPRLQLHYYLQDDAHEMNAFIRNKCEAELLAAFQYFAEQLGVEVSIESSAYEEGGLKEVLKFAFKPEHGYTNFMLALTLQAAFGLRRAESIKIQPEWADRGKHILLKDSWTKCGRAREIPIRNGEQRLVLDEAKALAGKDSLIPADQSFVEQLRRFEHQCAAADVHRVHGHRHQYAQVRYKELTGWLASAAGGPGSKELTPEQRELDQVARLTISAELGHEREQITAVYCGR